MAHQQLLVPPTSAKMPAPRSAGRFSRGGWKRGQFSPNKEVRRGKWSTVLWVFAQECERPHLPQCVLDRPNKPLPVSAAPRSSFSGVFPLNAPAGQLVLKLFNALADEKRADERICLLECSEVIRLDHFRGASPGHKAAERGEKTRGRHVGNDLNVHCASYHAGEETDVDLPHAVIFIPHM
ncbi:hypothetical protein T01_4083 [Trichinella spiralis]|uniref:Uncharacterized protein n=1 Tax=Trichinella spiralis TaxID=6334 RepID=A0A0V1ATR3_TRISP|nr:hypothetical protein T01_9945 [Trichinella spiralis]KRY28042.1 hypothetical protein T01_4083 [Trichinella spiralis]